MYVMKKSFTIIYKKSFSLFYGVWEIRMQVFFSCISHTSLIDARSNSYQGSLISDKTGRACIFLKKKFGNSIHKGL